MDRARRKFLATTTLTALGFALRGRPVFADAPPPLDLASLFGADYPTGVATCVVRAGKTDFLGAHGWADRERRVPMGVNSLLNIASVTKVFTATAIMQLVEAGRLGLDTPIDKHLPYVVRNPRYPDTPLTVRQLLTHRSSLADGPAYDAGYACGDPSIPLGEWLAAYLVPGGANWDAAHNFHSWAPGTIDPPEEPRPYSNIGYGLLGHMAERVTGQPFTALTRERVIAPLAMDGTDWMLANIDSGRHAMLYERVPDEAAGDSLRADMDAALWRDGPDAEGEPGSLRPLCLYGHPTYPDGFLRSCAADLGRFLLALTGKGELAGRRVLHATTLDTMLDDRHFGRALCWNSTTLGGRSDTLWYHNGSDPGVMTMLGFRPADGTGVAVLTNCGDPGPGMGDLIRAVFLEDS
ncbi:MAG: beta-lactamase family protein [bacterium]|nr:beta-lactamase family protein [bacterium]